MRTALKVKAAEVENNSTQVFWAGNSFLLRCVVNLLEKRFDSLLSMHSACILKKGQLDGILIHDGEVSEDVAGKFSLDFDISHFGQKPDTIVSGLAQKIFSGLI